MKKFFILLLIASACFNFQSEAQNPNECNPQFSFQFLTGSTVKFTPAIADSPALHHFWNFGDGSATVNAVSPSHTFPAGVFNVKHIVYRVNPNGIFICADSLVKVVTVQQGICNLTAAFSSQAAGTANPLQIFFVNQTSGFLPGDSIRWNFGDGTFSNDVNPSHLYANAGTYNVCIRVKRNTITPTAPPCISEICQQITVNAPCNITAGFISQASPANPATIQFTNTSTGYVSGDSVTWTFGDGSISHNLNPSHTYTANGTYQVCLRIQRGSDVAGSAPCIREICHTVSVTLPVTCNLNVSYTSQPVNNMPNVIQFTSTSTGYSPGDSVTWTFGDGSISHDLNPIHTYTTGGTYHVCLLIKKNNTGSAACIRESCRDISITVPVPCNLTANFTWYRDSSAVSTYSYHFTNTTAGLSNTDSIRWTFGDGTSSNAVNPNHVYAQPGTYQVCLRVQKRTAAGALTNCVSEKCYTVTVVQQCNLHPSFTWHRDSLNYKKIIFTNTTPITATNVVTAWSFGDGTSATSRNAVHEYAQAGTYTVCINIHYGNCSSYYCDTIVVSPPAPSCMQLSNYHYAAPAATSQLYNFAPNFISNDVQYTWTFGDGTGSHDINASHHYSTPGYYTVCLTAYKNANCASTTCNPVYVPAPPACSNIAVSFISQPDSLMPTRVKFIAVGNTAIIDQLWTITKLPIVAGTGTAAIHQNNPAYVFIDTGYYRVCLRATFANGCVKEYCNTIHVTQSVPGTSSCTLQAYPNPASSLINMNISLNAPQMLYGYIYNNANILVAQKQQQGFAGNNVFTVNIANLPAGIYALKLVHGNDICSANFIKQ